MGVIPPSCEPGTPDNPICVSDCGVPLHVIVDNDIQVEIPNPLPVEVQGTVCVSDCGTPIQVEVTNPLEIPQPLNVCQDPSCTPWLVEVTNPITIPEPLTVCIDEACQPIDVVVTSIPEVEIKNDVGNPIPVTGTVCIDDCGTPINVIVDNEIEIKNDVGNPIPVTGTVCVETCGDPLEVTGVVAIGCGPSTNATVTRFLIANAVQTIAAANPNRRNMIIFNEGSANLFVKYGAAASSTDYTVILTANQVWEIDEYGGQVTAIRGSAAAQGVQVTEVDCV